jgi:transcriptional regulator with XRE-family HTH domain
MDERMKEIRKKTGKSQESFANSLGLASRGKIANIEFGKITPDDDFISLVCRTYNVNEQWLRTGEGEMYTPLARDTEISEFYADLMKGVEPTFKRRFVAALTRLDESQWEILEKLCQEMMDEEKEKGPPE